MYFRSDKQAKTKRVQTHDIVALKHVLGGQLCEQIMFLHAFTGCDSTSRIYSIGKKSALGKLLKCETTLQASSTGFILKNQTRTMIAQLGSQAMVCLFGGSAGASLAEFRLEMFTKKVVTAKSFVTPERLPPTSSATRFHSLRVYYQLMVWSGLDGGMHAVD